MAKLAEFGKIFLFVVLGMVIWYFIYQILPATLIILTILALIISTIMYYKNN